LKYLDEENQQRREIAKIYDNLLNNDKIIKPNYPHQDEKNHVWHLYTIRCQKRDELQNYLTQNQIQTVIHYPIAPHKQEAYSEIKNLKLPITEKIHQEIISLPIYPNLNKDSVTLVSEIINKF